MTFDEWYQEHVPTHHRKVIDRTDWVKVWLREAFVAGGSSPDVVEVFAEELPESSVYVKCDQCQDSGYTNGGPQNGRNRSARRCPMRCAVRCSVCSDPNCDNPNGQH